MPVISEIVYYNIERVKFIANINHPKRTTKSQVFALMNKTAEDHSRKSFHSKYINHGL